MLWLIFAILTLIILAGLLVPLLRSASWPKRLRASITTLWSIATN